MFGFSADRDRKIRREEDALKRDFSGYVQGVFFDFSSPEIDPAEWWWPSVISSAPMGHQGFHIALGIGDLTETLIGATVGELARMAMAEATKAGKHVLYPGDRVTIEIIEALQIGGALDLPPDREALSVQFIVTRQDGTISKAGDTIVVRRGNLNAHTRNEKLVDVLSERANAISSHPERLHKLRMELDKKRDEVGQYLSKLKGIGSDDEPGLLGDMEEILASLAVDELVNFAALLGYRQAEAEAKQLMEPLAERTIERREQARQAASQPRIQDRGVFAKRYWEANPAATTHAVAVAYCSQEGKEADDVKSVSRSIQRYCPPSSPSYKG